MTRLTETQNIILSAGAQRPGNIAMPLPKGLHGAAARMAIGRMIERGLLEEVDANISKGDPLWCETGDGHGTTLKLTNAGLAAIGIVPEPQAQANPREKTDARPVRPALRAGTKQAQLIALLEAPEGATIEAIIAATGWESPQRSRLHVRDAGQETRADRNLGERRGQGPNVPYQPRNGTMPRVTIIIQPAGPPAQQSSCERTAEPDHAGAASMRW